MQAGSGASGFDPKLIYYVAKLLTLIKGEAELESVWRSAPKESIDCSCVSCGKLKPYDGVAPKKLDLICFALFPDTS